MARVRCCTDLDKAVLTQNFDKRSWIAVSTDEDWNFYWLVIYS
jgi:tubulin polyglutamylase TTLL1